MKKPESKLQAKCIRLLKEKGIYYENIVPNGWGMKGCPDVLSCINGRFIAFEFKVGENDMQDDQRVKRERIIKSGGGHYCPRSYQEFKEILDTLTQKGE